MENITYKFISIYTTDGKQSYFNNVTIRKMSNNICSWYRVYDAQYGFDIGDFRIDRIVKVVGRLK